MKNFRDTETPRLFRREVSRRLPMAIQETAYRKLLQLHSASRLDSLRIPPGNRLEKLRGWWGGRYSIRINDPWRICFLWRDGNAYDVEIVDYH
ncbi:MAG: type II toxin-antitoxin system RelE/ParE family toxin [Pseudomonadota bacterium]